MRRRRIVYETRYIVHRPYGCLDFLGDVFLTFATGGLWLIVIAVREMRR